MLNFTEDEIERYSRQIILSEIGGKGQQKLRESSVLIVGCGGLGSPAAFYLAAVGIGRIGLVDSDVVELNNLQRQILHTTADVGIAKVESAKKRMRALNPDIRIDAHKIRLTSENIMSIIKGYDFILDGSDNFPTRYLVNDACVMSKKPYSHAGILGFNGQAFTYIPSDESPCFRCLFPSPPPPGAVPSCQQAGILGVIAGILGVIQATEAIKYILKSGDLLVGRLLSYDALQMKFRIIKFRKDKSCSVCSANPKLTKLIDYELFCGIKK